MKQFCFNKGDDFLLDNNDIIIKLKNSIYGLAIGDALGVPVEFKLRNTMDKKPVNEMRGFGTYLQPRGTWSDDTSMTLATLDALSQSKYDIRKVSANYLKWMLTGKFAINRFVFDIGNTTRKSLLKCIVTGGIAGIIYPDDIPAIWLDQLRGKHIINKAISKYIKNICTK